ncbi:hypothetical protein ABE10_02000, partial [Bacillus toyonensis]|nr:hypothetical protein [Bacillus toyonensis]
PTLERQLPPLPAGGLLPAVQHVAAALPALSALGSAGDPAGEGIPLGSARGVSDPAVAVDLQRLRHGEHFLAGPLTAPDTDRGRCTR